MVKTTNSISSITKTEDNNYIKEQSIPSSIHSSSSISSLQDAQSSSKENSDKVSELQQDASIQHEEGVIEVVKRSDKEVDKEIEQLNDIEKVEPLIKIQEKKLGIENILTFKSSMKYEINKQVKNQNFSDFLTEILFDLQGHIEPQMISVNMEQRGLLRRIKHVDELSLSISQSMVFSLNQKKLVSEKLSEVVTIKERANTIQQQTAQVFKALSNIEKYLDPEDRISNYERWPHLNELYQNCTKKSSSSIESLIKSNSSEPSITLGSFATTSPLLEDLAGTDEQDKNSSSDTQATKSSFTPSLALSRLRGLSSMSISKYSQ